MKPKMVFKNQKELQKYGEEWQHKLSLDDWNIKFKLETYRESLDVSGTCHYQYTHKRAVITIYCEKVADDQLMEKVVIEKTLVHELLHCKFISLEDGSYESQVVENTNHRLIEELAKALIAAKYNLNLNWFKGSEDLE